MERYYDFEKLSDSIYSAIESAAGEVGLDVYHTLVVFAVLEAISSPLKNLKMHGGVIKTSIGRSGI